MNVVYDELIYKDEKNKKLGYVIKEGSNTYKSNTMKFVTSRKKKSSDLGVMLNHQLNPIGHSGVSSKVPFLKNEKFWILVGTDISLNYDNSFQTVKSQTSHHFHTSKKECEKRLINFVSENNNLKKGTHGLFVGGYKKSTVTHITTVKCLELDSLFFNLK